MEEGQLLAEIQDKLKRQWYRLTSHAEQEREAEKIGIDDIEEALVSRRAEVIESYPNDARGRSCLVLGFDARGSPLHVVCGLALENVVIVTVYRPRPDQWADWRKRRRPKL